MKKTKLKLWQSKKKLKESFKKRWIKQMRIKRNKLKQLKWKWKNRILN